MGGDDGNIRAKQWHSISASILDPSSSVSAYTTCLSASRAASTTALHV